MTNPDGLLDALSSDRRRAVIAFLGEHRDGVDLRELADVIGKHEAPVDADREKISDSQQAVYVALYQTHLPHLVKKDIVAKEKLHAGQGGHFVKPGPNFERALETLRAADPRADTTTPDSPASIGNRLRKLL